MGLSRIEKAVVDAVLERLFEPAVPASVFRAVLPSGAQLLEGGGSGLVRAVVDAVPKDYTKVIEDHLFKATLPTPTPTKSRLSETGRAAISRAAKRRWAAYRKSGKRR